MRRNRLAYVIARWPQRIRHLGSSHGWPWRSLWAFWRFSRRSPCPRSANPQWRFGRDSGSGSTLGIRRSSRIFFVSPLARSWCSITPDPRFTERRKWLSRERLWEVWLSSAIESSFLCANVETFQLLDARIKPAPGNAEKRGGGICSVSTREKPASATRAASSCRLLPPA
jgi:hypothetical protein